MAGSVYTINKGINKPVEFKGLKAQYIWYLGGGLVVLLILFAFLYIVGVNTFVCLITTLILGTLLFTRMYHLSDTYGEHGLLKRAARRRIPNTVRSHSRTLFFKKQQHGTCTRRHLPDPGRRA